MYSINDKDFDFLVELRRFKEINDATIGRLTAVTTGEFLCNTLEDLQREIKIKNSTAFPAGKYYVQKTWSPRFKQNMWLIYTTPQGDINKDGMFFNGVRIHWGNYAKDTDGCVLVGNYKNGALIENSKTTYKELLKKLPDKFILEVINEIKKPLN